MKRYKVIWFRGHIPNNITDENWLYESLKEIELEGETIDDINFMSVLPEDERKKFPYYVRGILYNDTNRVYDYGSYIRFIWAKEI